MYRILIAEDESEMRNLLVKYMRRNRPELEVVGSAVNGKEALELTEQYRPDIVLTDISMPVMDGLEFLQETITRSIPVKAVIISGYDEFSYARRAIALGVSDYLLKPFDPQELGEVLDKIQADLERQKVLLDNMQLLKEKVDINETQLKEQTLRRILEGRCESKPGDQVLQTDADYYCVCLLKLPLYLTSGKWDMGRQENIDELVTVLSGGCIPKEIQVQGLSFEENSAILIMSGQAAEQQLFFYKVKEGIAHLQASMEKYYEVHPICIVGGIYDTWQELPCSYQETLQAWRGITTTDKRLIVCGQKAENDEIEIADSTKRIQRLKEQILLSVRMGREDESRGLLEELIQVYASISPKKTEFVSISAEELVYAIFNEIEQNGIRLDENQSNESIQRQLKEQLKHASLLEIKELLLSYFSRCHRLFQEHKSRQQTETIVENVKNLIECNLDKEELTLEWIAGQVHFSATYVRQIFKQKTGERLMEYVIRKRMEKAARLLLKSDLRIQEIAETCGYRNQRYFASSFKKYYDCTPTEFKLQFGGNM